MSCSRNDRAGHLPEVQAHVVVVVVVVVVRVSDWGRDRSWSWEVV